MGMIFEKPSLRTHTSFETGMAQMGGHAVYLGPQQIGALDGSREPVKDISSVLTRMCDIVTARVFERDVNLDPRAFSPPTPILKGRVCWQSTTHHSCSSSQMSSCLGNPAAPQVIYALAEHAQCPIINALCNMEHPCQVMADFTTIIEHKGSLDGIKLAFVGDGNNNVTHSLALGCSMLGMDVSVAAPANDQMSKEISEKCLLRAPAPHVPQKSAPPLLCPTHLSLLQRHCLPVSLSHSISPLTTGKAFAAESGSTIVETLDPYEAVEGADVVYTDTFVSMGDEANKAAILKRFDGFQIDKKLMSAAKSNAVFMHDMPAYRGIEVTGDVIDGPQSIIYDQAANRQHAQKAVVLHLLDVSI